MTLHLVLKSKWYDMIASGEKKEEYRAITPYWTKRIWDKDPRVSDVIFHCGYTSKSMTFSIKNVSIGYGNPELGAPTDKKVFIISFN